MKRFWVSWEEPGQDSRPLKVPHPPEIKAWWESGIGEGYTTVCAVIDVEAEEDIGPLLEGFWEPQRFRFVYERTLDWRPGDRFPWPEEQPND